MPSWSTTTPARSRSMTTPNSSTRSASIVCSRRSAPWMLLRRAAYPGPVLPAVRTFVESPPMSTRTDPPSGRARYQSDHHVACSDSPRSFSSMVDPFPFTVPRTPRSPYKPSPSPPALRACSTAHPFETFKVVSWCRCHFHSGTSDTKPGPPSPKRACKKPRRYPGQRSPATFEDPYTTTRTLACSSSPASSRARAA